jgi:hypothetical protein
MRRELRRLSPDVRIDNEQIRMVLVNEVIKREVLEGDRAEDARRKISRAAANALRAKNVRQDTAESQPIVPAVAPEPPN